MAEQKNFVKRWSQFIYFLPKDDMFLSWNPIYGVQFIFCRLSRFPPSLVLSRNRDQNNKN